MVRATTRRNWRWELNGSWIFESRGEGAILFYPHGWGRAYLVPTEDKRRQIEEFLALWLTRLRSVICVSRRCAITAFAVCVAAVIPPVGRIVSQIPGWHPIFVFALAVGALACALIAASSLALRFIAETAKADLEKAGVRRPFAESMKEHARRSDWSLLWSEAALGSLFLGLGVRQLLPRQITVMHAASISPHFWTVGFPSIVLGGWMALIALWQIRTKFSG